MNIYERTFSGMVRTRTGFNFKIWREDLASGAYAERLRADPLAELWNIEHVDSFIALEHIGGTIVLDAGDRVALLLGDVDVVAAVAHQIARLKAWTMTHISGEADFFAAAAPLAIALGYDVDADREHYPLLDQLEAEYAETVPPWTGPIERELTPKDLQTRLLSNAPVVGYDVSARLVYFDLGIGTVLKVDRSDLAGRRICIGDCIAGLRVEAGTITIDDPRPKLTGLARLQAALGVPRD